MLIEGGSVLRCGRMDLALERRKLALLQALNLVEDTPRPAPRLAFTPGRDVMEDQIPPPMLRLRQRYVGNSGATRIHPISPHDLAGRQPNRRRPEFQDRWTVTGAGVDPDRTPRVARGWPVAESSRCDPEVPERLHHRGGELSDSAKAACCARPIPSELVREAEIEPGFGIGGIQRDVPFVAVYRSVKVTAIEGRAGISEQRA